MKKRERKLWLFLVPFSIVFFIFLALPLLMGIIQSLLSLDHGNVGLNNYIKMLKDAVFQKSLLNSCIYFLGNVVLIVISLIISILMRKIESSRLVKIYESLIIFPYILPLVVTGIVFKYIFQPQIGLFSKLMKTLGLRQLANIAIFSHPATARIAIIAIWVFVYLGYMVTIYLSSLRRIPQSYYESAEIDGANMLQRTLHITLPLLSNTLIYTMVTGFILTFQIMPLIWVTTGSGFGLSAGGPNNSTMSLDLYIYLTAFRENDINYASAMGVVMLLLTYVISLIPMKLVKEVQYD